MLKNLAWSKVKSRIQSVVLALPFMGWARHYWMPNVRRFQPIYRAIAEDTGVQLKLTDRAVPDFDADGALPPGVYHATWAQFEQRFSGSKRRKRLLEGLARQCKILQDCGCRRIAVGGSLVTRKRSPGDFDGCFDVDNVEFEILLRIDARFMHLHPDDTYKLERDFGGDLEPWIANGALEATPAEFLQFDIRTGKRKGIVVVHLA